MVLEANKTKNNIICVLSVLSGVLVAFLLSGSASAAAPQLVWTKTLPGAAIRESSPMPINYDGGTEDIVFGARNGKVYIINGDNGSNKPNWPQLTYNGIDSTPSSSDVDNDGLTDIFIGSGVSDQGQCSGGGMYRFSQTGVRLLVFNAADNAGESSAQCADPAIHASPVLADVTADGAPDVIFGALGLKFWNIRYDGIVNYGWPFYWDDTQFASVAVADLDGYGRAEIVAAGDSSPGAPIDHRGGMVRAFTGNGFQMWEYRVDEIVRSSPSVGDVDGDGNLEVVFGTGNYWVNNGGANDSTKIYVLNGRTGALKWVKNLNAQTLASPTLADFNGDGRIDIGIGTWEGADPGKVWLLDGVSGANLPGYPIASGGGIVLGQITTADLNGDGAQDPIVPTGGAVFAYNGKTGAQLWGIRQGVASYQNSPLVKDLDGNGRLDIVIAGTKPNGDALIDRYQLPVADPATEGSLGWHMFRKDSRLTGSWSSTKLSDPPSGAAGQGYVLFDRLGKSFSFGSSPYLGSLGGGPNDVVGGSFKKSANGYWLTATDGGVFTFGDAKFYGSTGAMTLNKPIVGMTSTPTGKGYWLVASDGGIFTFGDAKFYGSTGAMTLNKPIVGMTSTPTGKGYWLVASDGGIFAFGDAKFYGSTGAMTLNKPIVGMNKTDVGKGYWLVASDGGIFAFGDAPFHGSTGALSLVSPITKMMRAPGNGYWLVAQDGGVFSYNAPFYGSAAGMYNDTIVGGVVQAIE